LGTHHEPQGVALHAGRRHLPAGAQCDLVSLHDDDGTAGLLPAQANEPVVRAGRRAGRDSYYDTEPLRQTLDELVDFDRLNAGPLRFSVGAVNVRTGNFLFFDNKTTKIGAEHVMASGALPPAFPAVQIGTDFFWDGGIVSNTPLQHLLDQEDN
jgi:Predicted esterase of the alpha-beta hydrolase superfamily